MIEVGGRCKRMGILLLVLASLFLLIIAAVVVSDAYYEPGGTEPPPPIRRLPPGQQVAIKSALCCTMGLAALLFGFLGWRFVTGGASLRMTEKGLFLPAYPGARFGRSVPWDIFVAAKVLEAEAVPRIVRWHFRVMFWLWGDVLPLQLELSQPIKMLKFTSPLVSAISRLNDLSVRGYFAEHVRDRTTLEAIACDAVPFHVLITAINTLAADPELRHHYCAPDKVYVIRSDADGRPSYEPSEELSDWWSGHHPRA